MPCAERFLKQDASYQERVLPVSVRHRVAIEAGATGYWYRFVGLDGHVIGMDRFGASAPAEDVFNEVGITIEKAIQCIHQFGEAV